MRISPPSRAHQFAEFQAVPQAVDFILLSAAMLPFVLQALTKAQRQVSLIGPVAAVFVLSTLTKAMMQNEKFAFGFMNVIARFVALCRPSCTVLYLLNMLAS